MKKIYLLTTGLSFFIAVTFVPTAAVAQAPGGVDATDLVLWLKADASSTVNVTGSNVNSWTYFNNGSNSFSYTVGNKATVLSSALNFLPAISFDSTQMDGPTGANAPLAAGSVAYAVFAVWSTSEAGVTWGAYQRPWTQFGGSGDPTSGNGTSLWLYNNLWGDQPEIAPYTTGVGRSVSLNTYYITEMNLLNSGSNDLQLIDQNNIAGSPTILSTNGSTGNTIRAAGFTTAVNRLGMKDNANTGDVEAFYGNLAELIVYQVPVDNSTPVANARNQIFSYLGMKYGMPLGITLLASDGVTKAWDNSVNASFNNTVFGVGVDNNSGLNIQQSNSSATAGVSGAGNITIAPFYPITTDKTFLMIGNDNGALTEETTNLPAYAAGSSRFIRNWLSQNNGVSPVNLGFDFTGLQGSITGTVGTTSDFRLIVNYSGDVTFATTDGLYTPTSFTGNIANFSGVNLPNGSVFTIITNASGATPLPVNFVSFTAQPNAGSVDLNWVVNNNQQATSYEVDRSADGVRFEKIGTVQNDVDQTSYSYVDANAGAGMHYYRVLETDQDGKSIYSKVVSVTLGSGDFGVTVLNNPAVGKTDAQLQINAVSPGVAFIELWSVGGKRLSLQQEAIGTGTTTINVPMSNLAPGSYVVKVMVGNNTHVTQVVKM